MKNLGLFRKKKMIYYFYVSTIVSSSEGEGDPGQIANLFKAFLLDTAPLRFSSCFCHQIIYAKFYIVTFGGRNACPHSSIGN